MNPTDTSARDYYGRPGYNGPVSSGYTVNGQTWTAGNTSVDTAPLTPPNMFHTKLVEFPQSLKLGPPKVATARSLLQECEYYAQSDGIQRIFIEGVAFYLSTDTKTALKGEYCYALYNTSTLLKSLGYRGVFDDVSRTGQYRDLAVTTAIANIAHAALKDNWLPHMHEHTMMEIGSYRSLPLRAQLKQMAGKLQTRAMFGTQSQINAGYQRPNTLLSVPYRLPSNSGVPYLNPSYTTIKQQAEHLHNQYGHTTRVSIAGVEFFVGADSHSNVGWGWPLPLYNAGKLLTSLGYKDFYADPHIWNCYGYGALATTICNIAHALLVDRGLPNFTDEQMQSTQLVPRSLQFQQNDDCDNRVKLWKEAQPESVIYHGVTDQIIISTS